MFAPLVIAAVLDAAPAAFSQRELVGGLLNVMANVATALWSEYPEQLPVAEAVVVIVQMVWLLEPRSVPVMARVIEASNVDWAFAVIWKVLVHCL